MHLNKHTYEYIQTNDIYLFRHLSSIWERSLAIT